MNHPLVYEVNIRCRLRELSEQTGAPVTLANIPATEFDHWRDLGFSHIWPMGVWLSGPRARAEALNLQLPGLQDSDITGSPYAVAGYRVSPQLGGDAALTKFRQDLHAHRMKLLLDFVPNHVGLDHPWVKRRPELFVQSAVAAPGTFLEQTEDGPRWLAHGKDPYFPPWTDTAQLDYRQPATRQAMRGELLSVAERCDGVRCDMAMLLLNEVFERNWNHFPPLAADGPAGAQSGTAAGEFWSEAITETKAAFSEFLCLAEAYWGLEPRLQSLGFDYTYDKELYDAIIRRDPAAIQRRLVEAPASFLAASAHFLENHDEPRVASLLSPAEHRAAALLVLALPGMRLLHEGQLTGARIRTPVQLLRRLTEPHDVEVSRLYEQLLDALKNSAVGHGPYQLLQPRQPDQGNPSGQNVVFIQWQADRDQFDLAAVNLLSEPGRCSALVQADGLGRSSWDIRDLLGTEETTVRGADLETRGFRTELPPHGARLFRFRRAQ